MSIPAWQHIAAMAQGVPEKVAAPPPGRFFKGGAVWRRRYRLAADFVGFQGHFPGNPVLPAMAQVMLARDGAQSLAGPMTVAGIVQAKFLAPAVPDSVVTLFMAPPGEAGGDWLFQLFGGRPGADGEESETARLRLRLAAVGGEGTAWR